MHLIKPNAVEFQLIILVYQINTKAQQGMSTNPTVAVQSSGINTKDG